MLVPWVRIGSVVVVDLGSEESFLTQASNFVRSMINYRTDMTSDNLATILIFLKYWRNSHDVDQKFNLHILTHLEITCTKEYSQRSQIENGDSSNLSSVPDYCCHVENH